MKEFKASVLILLVFVLIFSGCSSKNVGSNGDGAKIADKSGGDSTKAVVTDKSPEDYKGEITIWSWYADWSKEYIKAFNKTYPNIKVNLVSYSYDDYFKKLYAAMQGGSGAPDIIEIEESQIATLIDSNQLEDLSKPPYDMDTSLFFESQNAEFTNSKGEYVGIPEASNPAGIWYKREIVKQYLGTDDPEEIRKLVGSGEEGYEKFITAMEKIAVNSEGKAKGIANLNVMLEMISYQNGNKFFKGDQLVYEEQYKETYNMLERIAKSHLTAGIDGGSAAYNDSFINGNVAFYPGAVWFEGYLIPKDGTQTGKWGFVPAPGPGYAQGDQATAIWKGSKNKELAWIFAKWFTSTKEAQMLQFKLGGIIPGLISAFEEPELQEMDPVTNQKTGPIFKEIFDNAGVKVHTTNDKAIYDSTKQALKELELNKIDGQEALQKVVDEAKKRIKDLNK